MSTVTTKTNIEVEVEVEGDYQPAEPQTHDAPGCAEHAEVSGVFIMLGDKRIELPRSLWADDEADLASELIDQVRDNERAYEEDRFGWFRGDKFLLKDSI